MMNMAEMRDVINSCEFADWQIEVQVDGTFTMGRPYLQIHCPGGKCAVTGRPHAWNGRKWFLSQHMTRSELVQTALMAVLASVEHEARERFLYRGRAVFGPHIDVEVLFGVHECMGDDVLDVRESTSQPVIETKCDVAPDGKHRFSGMEMPSGAAACVFCDEVEG